MYTLLQNSNLQDIIWYKIYRKASSRGAYGHDPFWSVFWRALTWFHNNRYYNGILQSDLVESSGYSSKTLQNGSCPYAPLDEVLQCILQRFYWWNEHKFELNAIVWIVEICPKVGLLKKKNVACRPTKWHNGHMTCSNFNDTWYNVARQLVF